jgi:NAD(P)-dependent dehydrogenase (short-subunit alcohol dehydrogenase family)
LLDAINRKVVAVDKLISANPLSRIAEVEDVVNAILFLASDQASYITGQTLFVDGAIVVGALAAVIR